MAAQPAEAAKCSRQEGPAIVEIAGTATGGSTAREAASPGATTPSQVNKEAEEMEAEQETGRKR